MARVFGAPPDVPGSSLGVGSFLDHHGFINLRSLDQHRAAARKANGGLEPFEALPRYGTIPCVYGKRLVTPALCAKPVVVSGFTHIVKCLGYGPLTISDLKIGGKQLNGGKVETVGAKKTVSTIFGGVEYEIAEGDSGDVGLTFYTLLKKDDQLNATMPNDTGKIVSTATGVNRAAEKSCSSFTLGFSFPNGISRPSGSYYQAITVRVSIYYRTVGSSTWLVAGTPSYTGQNNKNPITQTFTYKPAAGSGDYEFRVFYGVVTSGAPLPTGIWSYLQSSGPSVPSTLSGLAFISIRAKLQVGIDEAVTGLTAVVHRRLKTWNGSAWTSTATATSNPAAAYRDILIGAANGRALATARLDDAALGAWYTECSSNGYAFDHEFRNRGTVWSALHLVAAAGRASPTIKDSLYSVVREPNPSTATDVAPLMPRNTTRISVTKVVVEAPHALRCTFDNPSKDYQRDEYLVYRDGYSADGAGSDDPATKFEEKTFDGVVGTAHLYKLARYAFAVLEQRPETIVVEMDWENLALTRGDVVRVCDPVLGWGSASGRVTVVDGQTAHLDSEVEMAVGSTYEVRFWLQDGTNLLRTVTVAPGKRDRVACTSALTGVKAGDYFTFGLTGLDSVRALVRRVEPMAELGARITLVELGTGVYDAGSGTIPSHQSKVTVPPGMAKPKILSSSGSSGSSGSGSSGSLYVNLTGLSVGG